MMTAAAGFLLVLLCLSVGYGIYERRKTYRRIDRLLDSVLNQEMITSSDVQEGEFSALVSKIMQIQNVLGAQVERADEEKAQVKQLVSDMSHQLKTPLASLSVCAELLSRDDLSRERRREFEEKMQAEAEKKKLERAQRKKIKSSDSNEPLDPETEKMLLSEKERNRKRLAEARRQDAEKYGDEYVEVTDKDLM